MRISVKSWVPTEQYRLRGPCIPRSPRRQRGFTVVETFVSLVFLIMFMGMVYMVFFYSGKTQKVTMQLDAYHEARMLNYRLGSQLKFSNGVLFPSPGELGKAPISVHQLVFRDELNRIQVIFLTPDQNLMLLDYDDLRHNRLYQASQLGGGVTAFTVNQDARRVIEYQVTLQVDNKPYQITNRIKPVNQL